MEIFSASHGVKTFHAIIDNFSAASQVSSPAWVGRSFSQFGPCVCILQNNNCPIYHTIVKYSGYIKLIGSVVDSRQSTAPSRSNERHYALNLLKFLVIREAQWGSPDQLCCPCTDKWLPLFKGPAPHLDKQLNQRNTLKTIPSLMFEAGHSCLHPESIWT